MDARGSKGSVAPGDFEAAEPSAGSADDVAARDGGSQHAAGIDAAGEGEALRPVRNHAYRNVARVTGKTGKKKQGKKKKSNPKYFPIFNTPRRKY